MVEEEGGVRERGLRRWITGFVLILLLGTLGWRDAGKEGEGLGGCEVGWGIQGLRRWMR